MNLVDVMPLVSVCVVTYNHEKYIEECLLSVLRQECDFPFEIIVGEDCSTDSTRDIVVRLSREHPDVIIPVCNEKNLGMVGNYFAVHGLARGRFIAHLDGDDFWFPGKLRSQVDFLLKNRACSAVYTNALVVDLDRNPLGNFCDCSHDNFDINYFISGSNFLPHSSFMYRTEYRRVLFEVRHEKIIDFELHLTILRCGKAGFIDETFVGYRAGVPYSAISANGELVSEEIFRSLRDVRAHVDPYCFSRGVGVQKASRFANLLRQGRVVDAVWLPFVSLCGESRILALKSMIGEMSRRLCVKISRKLFGGAGRVTIFHPAPR